MIQNYLKTLVFVVTVLLSNAVFGQLKPFEDYSSCKVGFIWRRGDTLLPARFENLRQVHIPRPTSSIGETSPNWILSDNGRFGCLSYSGDWLIPCTYEALRYNEKLKIFVAKFQGKLGVLSKENKILVPFEFDEIRDEEEAFVANSTLLVKASGYGLYHIQGKQLIPPIYDELSLLNYEENSHRLNVPDFYKVKLNNRFGLLSGDGKRVTEVLFSEIKFLENQPSESVMHYFLAYNKQGEQTVIDENGRMLFPFLKARLVPAYKNSDYGWMETLKYVQAIFDDGSTHLISLTTGKRSETFKAYELIQNCVLLHYGDVWKLFDTDFNFLYSDSSQYSAYTFERGSIDYLVDYNPQFHSILYLAKYDSLSPLELEDCKKNKSHQKLGKQYCCDCQYVTHSALLDLHTGKRTDFCYSEIRAMQFDEDYSYWAFYDREADEHSPQTIDIFDSKGKKKKQLIVYGKVDRCLGSRNPWVYEHKIDGYFLYDIYGNLVTKMKFESYPEAVLYTSKKEGVIAQMEDRNGEEHFRYYDLNKQPLLDGRTFLGHDTHQDGKTLLGFLLMINPEWNTLVSNEFEVLLDSCSQLQRVWPDYFRMNEHEENYLTTKGEYAYFVHNWQVSVLDSTFFYGKNRTISVNYQGKSLTIDRNGKILTGLQKEVKKEDIPIGGIYFNYEGDTLIVKNYKHLVIQRIPNVRNYNDGGPWLHTGIWIYLKNNNLGFLSRNTGQWLVEPKNYSSIIPYQTGREDKFWIVDPAIDSVRFTLIDSEGKQLTKHLFDEPPVFLKNQYTTSFKMNKLVGIIDSAVRICTKPEFGYYLLSQNGYGEAFLFKDSLAFIVDHTSGKCFPISGQFLNRPFPLGHILYRNDSIRLLKSDGSPVTQFIPIKYAVEKLDLVNMLIGDIHKEGKSFPYYVRDELITNEMNNPALRKLNNRLLIENALSYKTTVETLNTSYDHCSIRPIWISKGYYSEELKGDRYKHSDRKELRQTLSYRNYLIGKDSLQLLTLSDLFKPNSNYSQLLDSLIEDEIQKNQVFGTVCADMPRAVYEFKQNFYMYGTKIHFLHYPGMREIYLELYQFRELLLHPEYFSLEQK